MRLFIGIIIALFFCAPLFAQWKQSTYLPDGTIGVHTVAAPSEINLRTNADFDQLAGFPKGFAADATFKNLRNLTLADLDGDGVQEIITGIDDQLYAFSKGQLLWQKQLDGIAIYPPSVADVDNDGALEIVQITGGIGATGAYLLEADGSDYPNWPLDFSDRWLLTAPTLVDLDGDQVMEIIILERFPPNGNIHIVRLDGASFSPNWPVAVAATPAVTPSVGDVDNDGELEIVMNSTEARYVFSLDGEAEEGFPILTHPRQRYSFQSPILADLDEDGDLEIVGATHSDNEINLPEFYVMQHDGKDYPGWPIPVPGRSWTFNTPTVVYINGAYRIFMSRPISTDAADMLYSWDKDGNLSPGFPIVKPGGLEGMISIVDVDGDDEPELVFGTNLIDEVGHGRIHAYEMDGSGEVTGFPIQPYGWTFLNGATFGDVDGNDTLDLVALTYTQTLGEGIDSAFINVYNLGVPYDPENILWGTYKGDNTRQGLVELPMVSASPELDVEALQVRLFPNPTQQATRLSLNLPNASSIQFDLLNAQGQFLQNIFSGQQIVGDWQVDIPMDDLPSGIYFGRLQIGEQVALLQINKI